MAWLTDRAALITGAGSGIGKAVARRYLEEGAAGIVGFDIFEDRLAAPASNFEDLTNTEALGNLLYTHYGLAFQISGLILFVAMVGAIVLTHRTRPGVHKQSVAKQQARKPEDVLEIRKVTPRTGA